MNYNYTVISKSGWTSDCWHVRQTFNSKLEAEAFARMTKHSDAKCDGYRIAIKVHRKPLARLLNKDNMIQFNDGTCATPSW